MPDYLIFLAEVAIYRYREIEIESIYHFVGFDYSFIDYNYSDCYYCCYYYSFNYSDYSDYYNYNINYFHYFDSYLMSNKMVYNFFLIYL